MKLNILLLAALLQVPGISAQSFLQAIDAYPKLSSFHQLLLANSTLAGGLLSNGSISAANGTNSTLHTILVPSNDAFTNYQKAYGHPIDRLSSSDLGNVIQYHSLQGALSSSDLQRPRGLVANTALTAPTYDNRELGSNGAQLPQVVYIAPPSTNGTVVVRQIRGTNAADRLVKSGLGSTVNVDFVNGRFDGGVFQIVDGFLTLPLNQTDTMTAQNLTSFVRGLDRTNVTIGTNAAKGLTCVCPSDEAFAAMGHLDQSTGNLTEGPASLLATLTRHAFKGSFYTTDFHDGDLLHSQNGYPILVSVKNQSIFLNDARIIKSNAITNNGAMHALDRVMGFLNTTTNVTTPANAPEYSNTADIPTPPPTSSASSASSFSPSATATPALTASGAATGSGSGTASLSASAAATSTGAAAYVGPPPRYSVSFAGVLLLVWGVVRIL